MRNLQRPFEGGIAGACKAHVDDAGAIVDGIIQGFEKIERLSSARPCIEGALVSRVRSQNLLC